MARPRRQPKQADARKLLEQVFDSLPGLEKKFRTLIEEAFDSVRFREVSTAITCKCCGEQRKYVVTVPIPDWRDRARAIDLLLTQAKGKPVETQRVDLSVFAEKSRKELEAMSDADLHALAASTEN